MADTYESLRDDVLHEAHRLQAEVATLVLMLEESEQARRRRGPFDWLRRFEDRLAAELGHRNHKQHYVGEYVGRWR
jgi:hypothetical protein